MPSVTTTVYAAFCETADAFPGHAFVAAPPAEGRAYLPAGVEFTYGHTREEVDFRREVAGRT